MSIGFLIARLVPTARFAQPIGAVIMYPMMAVSGLFAPVESLPQVAQAVAKVLPLIYAVSLLGGIWKGDARSAHARDQIGRTGFPKQMSAPPNTAREDMQNV